MHTGSEGVLTHNKLQKFVECNHLSLWKFRALYFILRQQIWLQCLITETRNGMCCKATPDIKGLSGFRVRMEARMIWNYMQKSGQKMKVTPRYRKVQVQKRNSKPSICCQTISPVKHYQDERNTPWKNQNTGDSWNWNHPLKIYLVL